MPASDEEQRKTSSRLLSQAALSLSFSRRSGSLEPFNFRRRILSRQMASHVRRPRERERERDGRRQFRVCTDALACKARLVIHRVIKSDATETIHGTYPEKLYCNWIYIRAEWERYCNATDEGRNECLFPAMHHLSDLTINHGQIQLLAALQETSETDRPRLSLAHYSFLH